MSQVIAQEVIETAIIASTETMEAAPAAPVDAALAQEIAEARPRYGYTREMEHFGAVFLGTASVPNAGHWDMFFIGRNPKIGQRFDTVVVRNGKKQVMGLERSFSHPLLIAARREAQKAKLMRFPVMLAFDVLCSTASNRDFTVQELECLEELKAYVSRSSEVQLLQALESGKGVSKTLYRWKGTINYSVEGAQDKKIERTSQFGEIAQYLQLTATDTSVLMAALIERLNRPRVEEVVEIDEIVITN